MSINGALRSNLLPLALRATRLRAFAPLLLQNNPPDCFVTELRAFKVERETGLFAQASRCSRFALRAFGLSLPCR